MARWIKLLNRQARFVVLKNRQMNWAREVACLKTLAQKTRAAIQKCRLSKSSKLDRVGMDQPNRAAVETLEPRMLFSGSDPSLIAYWALDEGTGDIVVDSAATPLDGDRNTSIWETDGRLGGAISFDGNGDVRVAYDSGNDKLNLTQTQSITGWFKTTQAANNDISIIRHDGHMTPLQLQDDGDARAVIWPAGQSSQNVSFDWDGIWNDDQWHHYALTYDYQQGIKIYMDGVLVTENTGLTGLLDSTTTDFMLGGSESGGEHYDGMLDDIRVYDRVLSSSQLLDLANPVALDRTDTPGTIVVAGGDNAANGEGTAQVVDNTSSTKWLHHSASSYLRFEFIDGNAYAINQYSLTSANDVPDRDPKDWSLYGTNTTPVNDVLDGSWTLLDTRTGEDFANRFEKRTFNLNNSTAYRYYRLEMTNNSGSMIQLAEVELLDLVNPAAGEITVTGDSSVSVNEPYTLTVSAPDLVSPQWTVDWGDGTVNNLLTHTYSNMASYDINVSVTDASGTYVVGPDLSVDATDLQLQMSFENDATDASASGNDGTLAGNATYGAGIAGGSALVLDGVGDTVQIAADSSLDIGANQDFTLSAWINPTTWTQNTGDGMRVISRHDGNSGGASWLRVMPDGTLQMGIREVGGGFERLESVSTIDTNVWHHIVGLRQGSQMKLYIDGVYEGSRSVATGELGSGGTVYLGGYRSGEENFNGAIDDARIYRRALGTQEIQTLVEQAIAGPSTLTVDVVQATPPQILVTGDPVVVPNQPYTLTVNAPDLVSPQWTVDWGDGTVNNLLTHTYTTLGNYDIGVSVTDASGTYTVEPDLSVDATDLQLHIPFEGDAQDVTGGNESVLVGNATIGAGIAGGSALVLDGDGDTVQIASDSSLDIGANQDLTLSAWINPTTWTQNNGDGMRIISRQDDNSGSYWIRVMPDGKLEMGIREVGGGYERLKSTSTISTNTWHHVAGVRDGSEMKLYIDGVYEGSLSVATGALGSGGPVYIGGYDNESENFNGAIDDARIYQRSLSLEEIQKLAALATTGLPALTVEVAQTLPPLLVEDFEDGDTGWSFEGANYNWHTAGGELVQNNYDWQSDTRAFWDDPAAFLWTDYAFEADFRSSDSDVIGVVFGYQDSSNYYRFSIQRRDSWRRLEKIEDGNYTLLAESAQGHNLDQDYHVKVQFESGVIRVEFDGQDQFGVVDDTASGTAITSGTVGLYNAWNSGSYYDNVVVTSLEFNAAPTIDAIATATQVDTSAGTVALAVGASDPEGGDLTYTWSVVSAPADAIVDFGTTNGTDTGGALTAAVDRSGSYTFQVTVADQWSASVIDTVTTTLVSASLPFTSDFSDGDLSAWTFTGNGSWSVDNGELKQTGNADNLTAILSNPGASTWSDYAFETNVRSADNDTFALLFGYQDEDNHYRFEMNRQSSWRGLIKIEDGVWSGLAYADLSGGEAGYVEDRDYHIRIEFVGGTIRVELDGVDQLGPVADSSHTQGTIGFKSWWNDETYFDDIVVVAAGDNVAPTIATAPTATIIDDAAGVFELSAAATDPNPDSPLRYTWQATSVPDGATVNFGDDNGTADGATLAATTDRPGNHTFELTVSDPWGLTATDTTSLVFNAARLYPLSLADFSIDRNSTNGTDDTGAEPYIRVENSAGHHDSYVKFDVSALHNATSVSLKLKIADSSSSLSGMSLNVDRIGGGFDNHWINYDPAQTPTVLSSIGTYDLSGLVAGDTLTITGPELLAAVQAAINDNGILGLWLTAPSGSPDAWVEFGSREHGDVTYIPRIEADHVVVPAVHVDGPALIDPAGGTYTFNFSVDSKPDGQVQWHVDWGDGQTETLTSTAKTVLADHTYAAGAGSVEVRVYAVDNTGRRFAGDSHFRDQVESLAANTLSWWRFDELQNADRVIDYGLVGQHADFQAGDARWSAVDPDVAPYPTHSGWVYGSADTSVWTWPGTLRAWHQPEYEITSGSISLFFNAGNISNAVILGKSREIDGNRFRIRTTPDSGSWDDTGRLSVSMGPDNTTLIQTANGAIRSREWNHMVLTWEASGTDTDLNLYLNGELVGTGTSPLDNGMADVTGRWLFGVNEVSHTSLNHSVFAGQIDEVVVLDTALTQAEINDLHQAESKTVTLARSSNPVSIGTLSGDHVSFKAGTDLLLTASGVANSGGAVEKVTFYRDGVEVGTDTDGTNGWSLAYDTAGLVEYSYTFSAIATEAGGSLASAPAFFTVGIFGDLSANLIGHWMLDDYEGGTATDISGSGNDGTLRGDAAFGPGFDGGGALVLDGDGDTVEIDSDSSLDIGANQDFTLSAWINPTTLTPNNWDGMRIISRQSGNSGGFYFIRLMPDGKLQMGIRAGSGANELLDSVSTISTNAWHHVAGVRQGGEMKLYIDGVYEGSLNVSTGSLGSGGPVYISGYDNSHENFNGAIDDARIYNDALNSAEIGYLSSQSPNQQVATPVVSIAGPTPSDEGSPATFTSTLTDAGAGGPYSYAWSATKDGIAYDLSGVTTDTDTLTFTPSDNGAYVMSLLVTDSNGGTGTDDFALTVNNVAPTVSIVGPTDVVEGSEAVFNSTVTDASVNDTHTYAWLVTKDGVAYDLSGVTTDTDTLTFTPSDNGAYAVSLTVTDSDGAVTTQDHALSTQNVAPTVSVNMPSVTVEEGSETTVGGQYVEPGNDTVTLSTSIGTVVDNGDGTWSWSFTPASGPGDTQVVTITATDEDGLSTSVDFDLIVNPVPTTYVFDMPFDGPGGYWVYNQASLELTDQLGLPGDNSSMKITGSTHANPFSNRGGIRIDLRTTNLLTDHTYEVGYWARGVQTNGSIYFSHQNGQGGNTTLGHTRTLTADWQYFTREFTLDKERDYLYIWSNLSNGAGYEFAIDNITIEQLNAPPAVSADDVSVTVAEGSPAAMTGLYSDQDADQVTLSASIGAVTDNGNGTWSWTHTPADGPDDTQTVTITATDANGAISTASFDLVVTNVAPELSIAGPADTGEGTEVVYTSALSDTWGVGPFTYAWSATKDGAAYDLTGVTTDANTLAFTPTDNGAFVVSLTVTDNHGAVTAQDHALTVSNVAPVINYYGFENDFSYEEWTLEGSLLWSYGEFMDMGRGDTFTGTMDWGDGSAPEALAIDTWDDGSSVYGWIYTEHTYADDGNYTVVVTLTDDDGGVSTFTDTVEVRNIEPVVSIAGPADVSEGGEASFTSAVADAGVNDTHNYAWSATKDGQAYDLSGVTTDSDTLTFMPIDNGVYEITLTVTDNGGAASTDGFALTVTNADPAVSIAGPASVTERNEATLTATVADLGDNDTHAYAWSVAKDGVAYGLAGLVIDTDTLIFTPQEHGDYIISLTVTDNDGGVTTEDYALSVHNVIDTVGVYFKASSSSINEGGGYSVDFWTDRPDIASWTIDWGDGNSETLDVATTTASHTYANGDAVHTPHVFATKTDGHVYHAPGVFDASYGTDGIYTNADYYGPKSVHGLADGSVLMAMWNNDVIKLDPTGQLDTSFGASGIASLGTISGLATDASSGFYIVDSQFNVSHYDAGGNLDTSFGTGGTASVSLPGTSSSSKDVVLDDQGRVLVMGTAYDGYNKLAVARLLANGNPDTSFNSDGTIVHDTGSSVTPTYLAIQSDGAVIVGLTSPSNELLRIDATGVIDLGFGNAGVLSLEPDLLINGLAVDSADRIAFTANDSNDPYTAIMNRFNSDGSVDSTFNGGGPVEIIAAGDGPHGNDIAIGEDDSLIMLGMHYSDDFMSHLAVAKLNSDGSFDTSFGDNGLWIDLLSGQANSTAGTFLDDGSLLVAGESYDGLFVLKLNKPLAVANVAPVVSIAGPTGVTEGSEAVFTSTLTDVGVNDTHTYAWSATSDGVAYELSGAATNIDTLTFRPSDHGVYAISLTVTDNDGGVTTEDYALSVYNMIQTGGVYFTASTSSINEGDSYTIDFWTDRTDVASWTIDWGDGTIETLATTATSASHPYVDGDAIYAPIVSVTATDGHVYHAAGALDASFGTDGVLNLTEASGVLDVVELAGGSLLVLTESNSVLKLDTAGQLDPTFGIGGQVTQSSIRSFAVDSTGVFYVDDGGFNVTRYDAAGDLDLTYGTSGTAIVGTSLPGTMDDSTALAVDAQGRVLLLGEYLEDNKGVVVARLDASGTLDTTYGSGGLATYSELDTDVSASGMAVMSDGGVAVALSNPQAQILRFDSAGMQDTNFGTAGLFILPPEVLTIDDIAVDSMDRIVASATDNNSLLLYRIDSAGMIDATFNGGEPAMLTNVNGMLAGLDLAFDTGDGLVVSGMQGTANYMLVAKLLSDGTLDTAFGDEGLWIGQYSSGMAYNSASTFLADGSLLVGGTIMSASGPYNDGLLLSKYSEPLTVANVAPSASIAGPTDVIAGNEAVFTSTVTDAGVNDTFTYAWSVTNDGVVYDLTGVTTNLNTLAFTPNGIGAYVMSLSVTDNNGSVTTEAYAVSVQSPIAATSVQIDDYVNYSDGGGYITLSWQPGSPSTGHYIFRKESGSDTWEQVGSVDAGVSVFTDSTVAAYTQYSYRIINHNNGNESAPADIDVTPYVPDADDDSDGLSNEQELSLGTNPGNADTDGDGLQDGFEASATGGALDPLSSDDPEGDADNDGLSNSDEQLYAMDPGSADSDGDGVNDKTEAETLSSIKLSVIDKGGTYNGSYYANYPMHNEWKLNVGTNSIQNPRVESQYAAHTRNAESFVYEVNNIYDVNIERLGGGTPPPGRGTWRKLHNASISANKTAVLHDPHNIMTYNSRNEYVYQNSSRYASLYLPVIDLDFVDSDVAEEDEADKSFYILPNRDDDDGDLIPDYLDESVSNEDDFIELSLKAFSENMQDLPGGFVLHFDNLYDGNQSEWETSIPFRAWKDVDRNEEVIFGETEFSIDTDHTIYLEHNIVDDYSFASEWYDHYGKFNIIVEYGLHYSNPPEANTYYSIRGTSTDIVSFTLLPPVELTNDANDDGTISSEDRQVTALDEEVFEVSAQNILVKNSDRNNNGILDFAEGYVGALNEADGYLLEKDNHTELILDLGGVANVSDFKTLAEIEYDPHAISIIGNSGQYDNDSLWIKFEYDSSDPLQNKVQNAEYDENGVVTALDGTLRLWKGWGSGTLDGQSILDAEGGDFIPADQWISFADLRPDDQLTEDSETYSASDYYSFIVEAVNPWFGEDLASVKVQLGFKANEDTEILAFGNADEVFYNIIEPEAPTHSDPTSAIGLEDGAGGGFPMLQSFLGYTRLDSQASSFSLPGLSGDPFAWNLLQALTWRVEDPVAGIGSIHPQLSSMPHLVRAGNSIIAVLGDNNRLYFDYFHDEEAEGYRNRFFGGEVLEKLYNDKFRLTDSAGNEFEFRLGDSRVVIHDNHLFPVAEHLADFGNDARGPIDAEGRRMVSGKLLSVETTYGQNITYHYKDEGDSTVLDYIEREIGNDGSNEFYETLVYNYKAGSLERNDAEGEEEVGPAPKLESIELKRGETTLRSMVFESAGEDEEDDLITLRDGGPAGAALEYTYFRKLDDPNAKGIYILDHAAYMRAGGAIAGIRSMSEQELLDAGAVFIGPDRGKVPGRAESNGTDNLGAGTGTYLLDTIDLMKSAVANGQEWQHGMNVERYRTFVNYQDALGGALPRSEIITLNSAREVLKHEITADGKTWTTKYTYDEDGRLLTASSPSGLTTEYRYYGDDEGDNSERLHEVWIATGNDPSATDYGANQLSEYTYVSHNDVIRIDTVTEKGGGGGSLGLPWQDLVTDFDYSFDTVSGELLVTTSLPDTSSTGGQAFSYSEMYDRFGRLIEVDSVYGYDTYEYDASTMALTTTIDWELTATTQFDEFGNIKFVEHPDATRTYYHLHQTDKRIERTTQSGWRLVDGTYRPLGNIEHSALNLETGEVHTTIFAPQSTQTPAPFEDFNQSLDLIGNYAPIFSQIDKYDKGGRLIDADVNHVSSTPGVLSSNPRTVYEYDKFGQLNKTHRYINQNEFITDETVYDNLGRVLQVKSANQLLQSYEYDSNGVGDGNVTKVISYPGGDEDNRETVNIYDWRNRLVASKHGVQSNELDINRPGYVYSYDNLDQLVRTQVFDADNSTPSYSASSDAVSWSSSTEGGTLQRTDYTDFDARGQVYRTRSIDPDTGRQVTSQRWYDGKGRMIKEKVPGGLTTKIAYDFASRVTDIYLTDDGSGVIDSVGSDTVIEHVQNKYDDAGNVIFTKTRQRNASGGMRDSYQSNYYDALGRIITSLNHGTNLPSSGEARPDDSLLDSTYSRTNAADYGTKFLRTDYAYSIPNGSEGHAVTVIDPKGIEYKTTTDLLGRTVQTITAVGKESDILDETEEATNGNEDSESIEKTTTFLHDGLGRTIEQTISLPTDTPKTTKYIFNNAGGRYLSHIQLSGYDEQLSLDEDGDGNPDGNTAPYLRYYQYNALGEALYTPAPSDSIRQKNTFDVLGRLIESEGEPGSAQSVISADGDTRSYKYDTLGNIIEFEVNSSIPNITREHNAFGQILNEKSGSNLSYTYSYENVNGGVRATGITYGQSGHVFTYAYGDPVDDAISRITSIKEGADELEKYAYLGLATPITITNDLLGANGKIEQSRLLDDFGRVLGQSWDKFNEGQALPQVPSIQSFSYQYDSSGRLTSIDSANETALDQTFVYDDLGRLTNHTGYLSEDWDSDETGLNRTTVDTSRTLAKQDNVRPILHGDYNDESDLGAGDLEVALEAWDLREGIGSTGRPNEAVTVISDSWGRIIERRDWALTHINSPTRFDNYNTSLTAERLYEYDALGRMVERRYDTDGTASDTRRRYIYDASGNIIEERVDKATSSHTAENPSYTLNDYTKVALWSPVTGELIFEDHNSDGAATTGTNLATGVDARYMTMVDIQGNTVVVTDQLGTEQARYAYTPSGRVSLVSGSTSEMYHLFQQGWWDTTGTYDSTILRGGAYHDSLTNGVINVSQSDYWRDQQAIDIGDLSWFDRNATLLVEGVHFGLDLGGLIPLFGIGFDLLNAGIYTYEGRYVEAGFSLGAAVPGLGYGAIAAKYGRAGFKAIRAGDAAVNGIQITDRSRRIYNASRAGDIGLNLGASSYYGAQGIATGNATQIGLAAFGFGVNGAAIARFGPGPRLGKTGVPNTGNPTLDALATSSSSFSRKINAIRRFGIEVIENRDLSRSTRGEFFLGKNGKHIFQYNPDTLTRLDFVHEWRHFKQLTRLQARGLNIRSKLIPLAEVSAYRLEQRVWSRLGINPTTEYLSFHAEQLSFYESQLRKSYSFLRYHPNYQGVKF